MSPGASGHSHTGEGRRSPGGQHRLAVGWSQVIVLWEKHFGHNFLKSRKFINYRGTWEENIEEEGAVPATLRLGLLGVARKCTTYDDSTSIGHGR